MTITNNQIVSCSWSGGKDSCYALMEAVKTGAKPVVLLNMMNENGKISRSHGLPISLLQKQADAIGVPLLAIPSDWNMYEKNFVNALQGIRDRYNVEAIVFGDIDLQAHRDWEEMVCKKAELTALLPIWKKDRKQLVYDMLASGIEAVIVSCNMVLGEEFLGKKITKELIPLLEEEGVDVCGENGEFHTIVINCPLFNERIVLPEYTTIRHEDYWFITWNAEN